MASVSKVKLSIAVLTAAAFLFAGALSRRSEAAPILYFAGESCEGGKNTVAFRWEGTSANASQLWLDLSVFDNGWLEGTFIGADVTGSSESRYEWKGLASRTTHYARLSQQIEDGSWESSITLGFSTRQCGRGPILSQGPTILGFSAGPVPNKAGMSPAGSTLTRSCGQDNLYAYLSIADPLGVVPVLIPDWVVDSVSQPRHSMIATVEGLGVTLRLSLGAVGTRSGPYTGWATLSFPTTEPPVEGSVTLTC